MKENMKPANPQMNPQKGHKITDEIRNGDNSKAFPSDVLEHAIQSKGGG